MSMNALLQTDGSEVRHRPVLTPCFTLLHLASPCFKLNAAAESGSLLAPMGTGWSGTISGFDRCQDQRARLPIWAYASVLKLVRTPCFTILPSVTNSAPE